MGQTQAGAFVSGQESRPDVLHVVSDALALWGVWLAGSLPRNPQARQMSQTEDGCLWFLVFGEDHGGFVLKVFETSVVEPTLHQSYARVGMPSQDHAQPPDTHTQEDPRVRDSLV